LHPTTVQENQDKMCQSIRLHFARPFRNALNVTATLATLALFGLTGCGRTTETPTTAPPADTKAPATSDAPKPSGGDFKVALVTSGPTSDNGWNAGAKKALDAVQKELGLSAAQVAMYENATAPGDQEKN